MNNNNRKNIIPAMIVAIAVLSAPMTSFAQTNFSDVKSTDWYCNEVDKAFEMGLINGKGDNLFDPQGTLTVGEAIKLAASARAMYDDELSSLSVNLGNGHWADKYVSYAKSKGIENEESNLDKVITRDEMAKIFASALPTSEYEQINDASLMPEKNVPSYVEQLFKAGIMIGDSEGFRLNDSITRAETACIINRVILPDERVEADYSNVYQENSKDVVSAYNKLGNYIRENGTLDNNDCYAVSTVLPGKNFDEDMTVTRNDDNIEISFLCVSEELNGKFIHLLKLCEDGMNTLEIHLYDMDMEPEKNILTVYATCSEDVAKITKAEWDEADGVITADLWDLINQALNKILKDTDIGFSLLDWDIQLSDFGIYY